MPKTRFTATSSAGEVFSRRSEHGYTFAVIATKSGPHGTGTVASFHETRALADRYAARLAAETYGAATYTDRRATAAQINAAATSYPSLANFATTKGGSEGMNEFRRALYGEHYGRPIWTVEVVPVVAD